MKLSKIYGDAPASSANMVWTPEVLAQEALIAFEDELMLGNLVYKDYSKEVASWGQTVNIGVPGTFTAARRTDNDPVVFTEGNSTSVAVVLNQYIYKSFFIGDIGSSMSRENLLNMYLIPAVRAVAEGVEYAIAGEMRNFLTNTVGQIGVVPTKNVLIDAKKVLDNNKVPANGRLLVMTNNASNDLLKEDIFEIGDAMGEIGKALQTGLMGRIMGFTGFQSGYMPSTTVAQVPLATVNATITSDAAIIASGVTSITVADAKVLANVVAGCWFIGTDLIPHRITAKSSNGGNTTVTFTPALRAAMPNPTTLTVFSGAVVDTSANGITAGYLPSGSTNWPAGHSKPLQMGTGFPVAPVPGQFVTTAAGDTYGAWVGNTTTKLNLNTALDVALADSALLHSAPYGDYSFAFNPQAIALVTRPLVTPSEMGVKSFVADYNGLAIRILMGYDMGYNQYRVTVDTLCGVKTLRSNAGVVILS